MNLRNLAITGVIILALLAAYAAVSQGGAMTGMGAQGAQGAGRPEQITYSQLVQRVEAGDVKEATIRGDQVNGVYKNDGRFTATTPYPNE
ncbi:MAG: ATP-dependent metallopeptidase FtsH/Yme1/Tma family protein, partial [Brevundimonas sp.]